MCKAQNNVYHHRCQGHCEITTLNFIQAWTSNHMPCKLWDEITYLFPNFNSYTVEVWKLMNNLFHAL